LYWNTIRMSMFAFGIVYNLQFIYISHLNEMKAQVIHELARYSYAAVVKNLSFPPTKLMSLLNRYRRQHIATLGEEVYLNRHLVSNTLMIAICSYLPFNVCMTAKLMHQRLIFTEMAFSYLVMGSSFALLFPAIKVFIKFSDILYSMHIVL